MTRYSFALLTAFLFATILTLSDAIDDETSPFCTSHQDSQADNSYCTCSNSQSYSMYCDGTCPWSTDPPAAYTLPARDSRSVYECITTTAAVGVPITNGPQPTRTDQTAPTVTSAVITRTEGEGPPETVTWSAVQTSTRTEVDGRETIVPAPFWICTGGFCGAAGACAIPIVCGGSVAGGGFPPVSPPEYDPPKEDDPQDNQDDDSTEEATTSCRPITTCFESVIVSTPSGATTEESSTTKDCRAVTTATCGATGATSFFTSTISATCNVPLTDLPEPSSTHQDFGGYTDWDDTLPIITAMPTETSSTRTRGPDPYCSPYQNPRQGLSYCTCSDSKSYSFLERGQCPQTKPATSEALPVQASPTPPPQSTDSRGYAYYSTNLGDGVIYGCPSYSMDRTLVPGLPITKCVDGKSIGQAFTRTTAEPPKPTCPGLRWVEDELRGGWAKGIPSCWDCPKDANGEGNLSCYQGSCSCGAPCDDTLCKFD